MGPRIPYLSTSRSRLEIENDIVVFEINTLQFA